METNKDFDVQGSLVLPINYNTIAPSNYEATGNAAGFLNDYNVDVVKVVIRLKNGAVIHHQSTTFNFEWHEAYSQDDE